jgi:beta-glucosidase
MKKASIFLFILLICRLINAQQYPFQNINLSEKERIENLISLMTLDEKIGCLSTRISVPGLGVTGTHTIEGLHGLAYSGPANWAVRGAKASPTTTFPQAIGLAQMWDPELLQKVAEWEATECRYLAQTWITSIDQLPPSLPGVIAPFRDFGGG